MSCSIGSVESESACSGSCTDRSSLNDECTRTIKIRAGIKKKIKTVCEAHLRKYMYGFASHQTACCDPYDLHRQEGKKFKSRSLTEITLLFRDKAKSLGLSLIPGKKLCVNCKVKLFQTLKEAGIDLPTVESSPSVPSSSQKSEAVSEKSLSEGHSAGSPYIIQASASLLGLNDWLQSHGEALIDLQKLKVQKHYFDRELDRIQTVLESCAGKISVPRNSIKTLKENASLYIEFLHQLKVHYDKTESDAERVQALSVLPASLSVPQIKEYFGASERLVRKTKSLVAEKGLLCTPNRKIGKSISAETLKAVLKFYYRQDISRELPGKNNVVSVKDNGKRIQKQKHLVLGNISHLHDKLCEENNNIKISRSKFASLRPKECVLASSSGMHNVCVCIIHENPQLMFKGGHLKDLTGISSLTNCLKYLVCPVPGVNCHLRLCKDCPDSTELRETLEVAFDKEMIESVTYNQWETTDRSNIVTHSTPALDFIDEFLIRIEALVTHHFLTKSQAEYYNNVLNNLEVGVVVVNADFAENFGFIVQDSVQGFYFSNRQATIHPFSCYFVDPSNSNIQQASYAVISDHMDHSTIAVHAFQKKLVEILKTLLPEIKKIVYFSDGCSAQYKNKKNVANLWFHEFDFGIPAEWHFFATSHGKSACDGIGGTIKRLTSNYCLQHTEPGTQITTPYRLYEWTQSNIKGIFTIWVSSEDVEQADQYLSVRFETAKSIKGVKSCHAIVPLKEDHAVTIKRYSSAMDGERREISIQEKGIKFTDVKGFISFWRAHEKTWHLGYVEKSLPGQKSFNILVLKPSSDGKKYCYNFSSEVEQLSFDFVLTLAQPNITAHGKVVKLTKAQAMAVDAAYRNKLQKE